MATPGYNESSVVLPSFFGPPGAAMENAISRQQQDKMFNYRMQKDNEMDEWRKVNLMKELTNLDDYQTGSDVANAIGNKLSGDVLQKYTAAAKNMSPSELLAKISSEMSTIHSGLQGLKTEMDVSDKQLAMLKQQFPELDMAQLSKDYRGDIINRRIKGDNAFVNPLEIQPSSVNLGDRRFLSRYMRGDKALREAITNPKGLEDVGVATGNIVENIEYGGKRSPWKIPNFTNEQMQGGFLPKGFIPQLKVKEQPIPTDVIKGADGKQLMGVPDDVYSSFAEDDNLGMQLTNSARSKFKNYDEMTPEQQTAAEKATLREMLDMDKTDFRFITSKRAPVQKTSNTFNMGAGASDSEINKVYERIDDKINDDLGKGFTGTRFNALDNDGQEAVKKAVENAGYKGGEDESAIGEGGRNVFLYKDRDGKIKIYRVSDSGELVIKPEYEIASLSYTGTNLPKQANVKGKVQTIRKGESGEGVTPVPKAKKDPLGLF